MSKIQVDQSPFIASKVFFENICVKDLSAVYGTACTKLTNMLCMCVQICVSNESPCKEHRVPGERGTKLKLSNIPQNLLNACDLDGGEYTTFVS